VIQAGDPFDIEGRVKVGLYDDVEGVDLYL